MTYSTQAELEEKKPPLSGPWAKREGLTEDERHAAFDLDECDDFWVMNSQLSPEMFRERAMEVISDLMYEVKWLYTERDRGNK